MSRRHPLDQGQHKLMVDASALVALFDPADQFHREAINFRDAFILRYEIQLFTTSYIHSETMSQLTRLPIQVLQQLDALIRRPPTDRPLRMTQLWVTEDTIEKALPIYFKYKDQAFSIIDCTSFVLMEENGIKAAFTFDNDYKIYTYQKGHESTRQAFWKLPEMLRSYMTTSTS